MIDTLHLTLSDLARAGGGGSGGGSGGSGGGGGVEGIALLGYIPSYYLGKLIKKYLPRTAELIVSIAGATIMSLVLVSFGVTLHGFGLFYVSLIIIGIWVGWYAAFFGTWQKLKNKYTKKTKGELAVAAANDSIWDEGYLTSHVKQTFMAYQNDWSQFNLQNIQTYTTPLYSMRTELMLHALHDMHRQNILTDIVIEDVVITSITDSPDNSRDAFVAGIKASAKDIIVDTTANTTLYTDKSSFIEYWKFIRTGDQWLLNSISQDTADANTHNADIEEFARNNQLFYSLDMGWLYLPRKGLLFKNGKFGASDINNHVIGLYGNNLIQLYTYYETTSNNKFITQIALPTSYGGILVRSRKGFLQSLFTTRPPKGYIKHTFEWPDFNNRYEVYATDRDRLAAFELINPGFMAYLYDTDIHATIEVVDNIVYIYKDIPQQKSTRMQSSHDYETFLTILQKAAKELKL